MGRTKGKKMKQKRLPWGRTRSMSKEEYKQYKRDLQTRWRHAHPEWVKQSNKKWAEIYSKTKPFECICVHCGKKFNASRNSQKSCPDCVNIRHSAAEKKRKEWLEKKNKRQEDIKQILVMAKKGIKEKIIAETLGRSQSGVSQIMKENGIVRVIKPKKNVAKQ